MSNSIKDELDIALVYLESIHQKIVSSANYGAAIMSRKAINNLRDAKDIWVDSIAETAKEQDK